MIRRKTDRPRHFLREWRQHRGFSLERVAEQVEAISAERLIADPDHRTMSMTHATLSRIERGLIPYNQHLLEVLADIYQTDCASLIMRDPSAPDAIWSIWEQLRPPERVQMVEIGKALLKAARGG